MKFLFEDTVSNYIYIGAFFDKNELCDIKQPTMERVVKYPHITFAFKPKEVPEELFGTEIKATIVGYGSDKKLGNEGFKVEIDTSNLPDEVKELVSKIDTPHITLATESYGKPANTKYVEFNKCRPISILGTFGGFTSSGKVITAG